MSIAEARVLSFQRKALVPPRPKPAADGLTTLQRMIAIRRNIITVWGPRAYQDDIITGKFLGQNNYILNAPEAIRHVLIDNHQNYLHPPISLRVLRPILGNGLLISHGKAWRHQRRTLAPAFTPRAVTTLVPHILASIDEAIDELNKTCGEPIDLRQAMRNMTLEIAARTMFSLEMGERGTKLRNFVSRYIARHTHPQFLDMLLPLAIPSPADIGRALFRRRWTHFVRTLVRERRPTAQLAGAADDQQIGPRDLFDLIVSARDPETGEGFTDEQLGDQVTTMIVAGYETTATALFWSLYLLSLDPVTQEELADSVKPLAIDAKTEISSLPFARAVIDEAMRLYPPVFLIMREAIDPDTVAGHAIKSKDVLRISPWLLQRHEKLWQDPDAFIPRRFMPGSPSPDRFAYMPFGAGPRTCIGAHFALVEVTLALARIMQTFRVEIISTRPVMPVGAVTTQPDHSPAFRLSRR
jgi:cytochrome P450